MRHDAPIAGGAGACGGPDAGREGGLDQGRAEPAVALAGALLDEERAVPSGIAEFADRGGRHDAGAEKAVLEQLSDPARVVDGGLAAGALGDLGGRWRGHPCTRRHDVARRARRHHGGVPEAPSSVRVRTRGTHRAAGGSERRRGKGSPFSCGRVGRRPMDAYVRYGPLEHGRHLLDAPIGDLHGVSFHRIPGKKCSPPTVRASHRLQCRKLSGAACRHLMVPEEVFGTVRDVVGFSCQHATTRRSLQMPAEHRPIELDGATAVRA